MAENLKIKLDLLKLRGAKVAKNKSGETGLWLPVEKAGLYAGEKGVYLDLVAWPSKENEYGHSHGVKQSFDKEVMERMSEEERRALPFLGNVSVMKKASVADCALPVDDDLDF